MGIMILSLIASMVMGSIIWLVIGSKFPLNEPEDAKLPVLNNIVIYFLLSVVPVYLLIFLIFS